MQKQIATWNPARGVWETDRASLLCEHLAPFLETWPPSGMTRDGVAFELPTWEHRMAASVSSSSPILGTPTTSPAVRSSSHRSVNPNPAEVAESIAETGRVLPTPRPSDAKGPGVHGDGGLDLRTSISLLPTPTASDTGNGQDPEAREARGHGAYLEDIDRLLPTPTASNQNSGKARNGTGGPSLEEVAGERLLPTPTAAAQSGQCRHGFGPQDLLHQLTCPSCEGTRLLPTPTATDAKGSRRSTARAEGWQSNPGTTLTDFAWEHSDASAASSPMTRSERLARLALPDIGIALSASDEGTTTPTALLAIPLLPTPRATDGTKGGPNQRGSSGDRMLPSAVHHLLPTPRASEPTASRADHAPTLSQVVTGTPSIEIDSLTEKPRKLVSLSSGDPTDPQSSDGSDFSDGMLPLPPS